MTRTFKDKKEMTFQLNLPKTTSNTRALISPSGYVCVFTFLRRLNCSPTGLEDLLSLWKEERVHIIVTDAFLL